MKSFLNEVFDAYVESYKFALSQKEFKPWIGERNTINEANQVHRFLDSYCNLNKNTIAWMELPIHRLSKDGNKYTAHIDGFLLDRENNRLVFIEAKRFSRDKQIESLKEDVNRIHDILDDNYNGRGTTQKLELGEYDVYCLFLADIRAKNEATKTMIEEWRVCLNDLRINGMRPERKKHAVIIRGYHLAAYLMKYDPSYIVKQSNDNSRSRSPQEQPGL